MTVARSTAPYPSRSVARRRPGRTAALGVALAVLAALLAAAVGPASPATAAPGGTNDVIFSLDGSGSIDDTDWALQRNSYAAALLDTAAFPRDGSIAVGVVQWSSTVQLEAPLRVISNENDVDALRATILGLDQLANSTNPGDGLRFSADQLAGSGRPDPTTWSVCMSTDGTTNSGESLGSAVAHAQSVGVDRFSVIGIEDFGNGASLAALLRAGGLRRRHLHPGAQHRRVREPDHRRLHQRPRRARRARGQPGRAELEERRRAGRRQADRRARLRAGPRR